MNISFNSVNVDFKFGKSHLLSNLINRIVSDAGKIAGEISVVFTTDEYLLEINKKYLKHYYYTDVITFADNRKDSINGDIYISIDTVRKNSEDCNMGNFEEELCRVVVHGILHLIGFEDETYEKKKLMKNKEDFYLKRMEEL